MADGRANTTGVGPGNLRERMLTGGFWVGASRLGVQAVQFAVTVALAHILFPRDFGLFAMCALATGLSWSLTELGLTNALVQAKALTRASEVSVFWFSIVMSAGLYLALYLAAGPIARLFDEPRVVSLIRVLAVATPITAASVVPTGLLFRRLDFKSEGFAELARALAYGVAALTGAAAGAGVWSLVAGELAGAATRTVVTFARARWLPGWTVRFASLRSLMAFGLNLTGASFFMAARDNVDKLIIGRILGAATLGGYTLAYRVITAPQSRISNMIERVTFPGFAAIQEDRERMRAIYRRVVKLTALISFPALAWTAAAAKPFVAVVFGEKWLFILQPLQILCLAGAFYAIFTPVRSVILGTGRASWEFGQYFISFLLVTVAVAVGARYGLVGVAVAFTAQAIISYAVYQTMGHRLLSLRFKHFLGLMALPVGLSAAVGLATAAAVNLAGRFLPNGVVLAVAVPVGAFVYVGGLVAARPEELSTVISVALDKLRAYKDAPIIGRFVFKGKKANR